MAEFERHLQRQYSDRTIYWAARSASRILSLPSGRRTIAMITDAIDHGKYRYPRSQVTTSKELSGFLRPAMDCTTVIVHGHLVLNALSEPYLRKDSSWSTELLSHAIHSLPLDLRSAEVAIQSDNCSRETKNNTLARWAGTMVGLHRVHRMELRFLSTGHSHEDVDQYFSAMSNMLERHCELHRPCDFIEALEGWLSDPSVRPHEPLRSSKLVGRVRNWHLVSLRASVCLVVALMFLPFPTLLTRGFHPRTVLVIFFVVPLGVCLICCLKIQL